MRDLTPRQVAADLFAHAINAARVPSVPVCGFGDRCKVDHVETQAELDQRRRHLLAQAVAALEAALETERLTADPEQPDEPAIRGMADRAARLLSRMGDDDAKS